MMWVRRLVWLWLLVGPGLATPIAAQTIGAALPLAGLAGDHFSLRSDAVGRTFHIHVRFPEAYAAEPARTWPTVYATDGDALFPVIAVNHLFLHYDDKAPDALVVGIAYGGFGPELNKRGVDFDGARGAAAFQAFLRNELIPLIERRYRADPARRILVGQSAGGAFVLYSAFTDPDLFWGRIASNPAIDPAAPWLSRPAPARRGDLNLIVVSGTRDRPTWRGAAQSWIRSWRDRRDLPWRLATHDLEDGTHAADFTGAYRLGLHALFPAEIKRPPPLP